MKNLFILLFTFSLSHITLAQPWQSKYVRVSKEGTLVYTPDPRGNIIPDFSKVGYHHQQQSIPDVPVVKVLHPGNNDQQNIQAAIDELSQLPINTDGFRGTILLKAGTYKIHGTIRIAASGIVLRGEGDQTKLISSGKGKRDLIHINGKGNPQEVGNTRVEIIDSFVPVGRTSFRVRSTDKYKVGDRIILFRPGTKEWISAIKMDQIEKRDDSTRQWQPQEYDLHFERRIIKIDGNKIWIDNPVMMEIEKRFGGGQIYKYQFSERLSEIGIEKLALESEYQSATDEDHGWVGIYFNRIENGWVDNVSVKYFGYSAVNLGMYAKNITVQFSRCLEAKSQITGSRRYSFNNDGQQNLIQHCFATEGRHDYITGARVCGPNVFYNCRAEKTHADIGPHHRWAVGTLYDNIATDGEINIQDRGNWGTGHGWAGVTQILWNCKAARIAVQSPWYSGKNYAIGVRGEKYEGRLKQRPDGEWEGLNAAGLKPTSLFEIQTEKNKSTVAHFITNEIKGTISSSILKEAKHSLLQTPVTITSYKAVRSAGNIHDFYSEGDYWWPNPLSPDSPYIQKDGMSNPDNFTRHRELMLRFSRIVASLVSAYKITSDKKYLASALRHCKAWFINSDTRMNPSLLYAQAIKGRVTGRGIGIIDTIHLIEVVQALMMMESIDFINQKELSLYKNWFTEYLKWLTTHSYGKEEMNARNNHGTCWVMQVAAFSKFVKNEELLHFCRERYKTVLLPQQMAADGSFPLELRRTKPYGYSIFNLDAMVSICHLLSDREEDLWSYQTPDGRSIRSALDFLIPYISDKERWPFTKDVMYWNNWPVAQPFLIFGARKYQNTQWMELWKKLDHAPTETEVIRNLPIRNPLLWLD